MPNIINEPVSVNLAFDSQKKRVFPKWVIWKNRLYPISKVGLHHTVRRGRTLFHVFSVTTKTLFLRLALDTETLYWKLEEVDDGIPS